MNFFKPKFWDKTEISLFTILLFPIAIILKLLIFLRKSFTKKNHLSIPIICIGNIYLGGTGKTPLSIEIFSILKSLNKSPAFIRKRYKSFQDEVALQEQVGSVFQNRKRLTAIKEAIQSKADVAILDDGFQDFSVYKNFSIICFNEKQWIGNGLTIPAGPLREELSALKRANCVIINGEKNISIENSIYSNNKKIKIFYSKYKLKNINEFKNKKVIAFAGIGNPINFFNLLEKNGIDIIEKIKFPDHHKYSDKELKNLSNKIKDNDTILLTTEKDYFRINQELKKKIKYLKISIKIENENEFINEIKKVI